MGRLISRLSPYLQSRLAWDAASGACSALTNGTFLRKPCTRSKECNSLFQLLPALRGGPAADFHTDSLPEAGSALHRRTFTAKVQLHPCTQTLYQQLPL